MRRTDRRRSVRRSVALECHVHSTYWDGTVPFVACDLSMDGIWLASDYTLEAGEEVMLSFVPPGSEHGEILATARVARVSAREGQPSGMGLSFSFMRSTDRAILARSLEGRPPPLPGRRAPPEVPARTGVPPLALGA